MKPTFHIAFLDGDLHADFRESLMIYYRRIPEVSLSPHRMWLERDIDALLSRAAGIDGLAWLCVVHLGVVFADQGCIGALLQEAIASIDGATTGMRGPGISIIDLRAFRKIGRPKFAALTGWAPLTEPLSTATVFGNPAVDTEKMKRNLQRLYAMEELENPCQRAILGYLINRKLALQPSAIPDVGLVDKMGTIFLFNTEALGLPAGATRPLDHYFGPCAGFLEVAALYIYGFHENTKIVYYDINQRSIEVKQRIWREFDGQLSKLGGYFAELIKAYPPELSFSVGDVEAEIDKILRIFGNEAEFASHWQKVRQLRVEYVHLNLLTHHHNLFVRMGEADSALVAVSDIFTGLNELTYGHTATENYFSDFLQTCRRYPNLLISGNDMNNRRIFGAAARLEFPDVGAL